jgi:hypothetical protein
VRHLLRQGVQTQTKMIDHQNGTDQNDADNHHQDIGVTRSGDEAWQVMGGGLDEVTRSCDSPFRNGKRRAGQKPRAMAQVLETPAYLAQSRNLASLSARRGGIGVGEGSLLKFPRHSRRT